MKKYDYIKSDRPIPLERYCLITARKKCRNSPNQTSAEMHGLPPLRAENRREMCYHTKLFVSQLPHAHTCLHNDRY